MNRKNKPTSISNVGLIYYNSAKSFVIFQDSEIPLEKANRKISALNNKNSTLFDKKLKIIILFTRDLIPITNETINPISIIDKTEILKLKFMLVN